MNSMLRQHHVRLQDLQPYLRGYDPSKPTAPDDWAKSESARYEPGALIFCLDAVAMPPGLSQFGKKEPESGESYRVKDLCVVVGRDGGKPLGVNMTASAYEQRFLEVLLLEKARKAILDGKDFLYVAAQPAQKLAESTIKDLEQLGGLYAKGGSRRSLTAEGGGLLEPAAALLGALGVRILPQTGSVKTVVEISSVCRMIFAPEAGQDDKNKMLMKACFSPIPSSVSQAASVVPIVQAAPIAPGPASAPVEASEHSLSEPAQFHAGVPSLAPGQLYNTLNEYIESGQLPKPFLPQRTGDIPNLVEMDLAQLEAEQAPIQNELPTGVDNGDVAPSQGQTRFDQSAELRPKAEGILPTESKTKLPVSGPTEPFVEPVVRPAESITGMTVEKGGEPFSQSAKAEIVLPAEESLPRLKPKVSDLADRTFIDLASPLNVEILAPDNEPPYSEVPAASYAPEAAPVEPVSHPLAGQLPPTSSPGASTTPEAGAGVESGAESERGTSPRNTFSDLIGPKERADHVAPESSVPLPNPPPAATPTPAVAYSLENKAPAAGARQSVEFQEPKLVLNEMAALMSKLELQVAKASKRLASRAEEIEQRLSKQIEILMEEVAQEDKDVEASMLVLGDTFGKEFEQTSESLRQRIADAASEGRQSINELTMKSQSEIDNRRDSISQELESACAQFRADTEGLISDSKDTLNKLLNDNLNAMADVFKTILDRLDDLTADQCNKLKERFERFRERMSDETSAVLSTIERNVRSMGDEVEGSWQRASEKLRLSQSDFEQTVLHAVRVAELALSQSARTLLVGQFLPKLKERQQIVTSMVAEMTNTFTEQSLNQSRGQLIGLEASLASARQQLQVLVEECLMKIDSVGRDQQSVLEDLFKETSGYLEQSTSEVLDLLKKAENQILESEAVCKKLAETFSLDADPLLSEERNLAMTVVQSLRNQFKKELEDAAQLSCEKLDELAQQVQSQLVSTRLAKIQAVREAADDGLNQIREAIQEAFNAIQASREKHMT